MIVKTLLIRTQVLWLIHELMEGTSNLKPTPIETVFDYKTLDFMECKVAGF